MPDAEDLIRYAWRRFNVDGVPSSDYNHPNITDQRDALLALLDLLDDLIDAITTGSLLFETWAELEAVTDVENGTRAEVINDAGSHNDPTTPSNSPDEVPNEGIYSFDTSVSPPGWKWLSARFSGVSEADFDAAIAALDLRQSYDESVRLESEAGTHGVHWRYSNTVELDENDSVIGGIDGEPFQDDLLRRDFPVMWAHPDYHIAWVGANDELLGYFPKDHVPRYSLSVQPGTPDKVWLHDGLTAFELRSDPNVTSVFYGGGVVRDVALWMEQTAYSPPVQRPRFFSTRRNIPRETQRLLKGITRLVILPCYGASNTVGGGHVDVINSTAPVTNGRALTFAKGPRVAHFSQEIDNVAPLDFRYLRDLTHCYELTDWWLDRGETPVTGMVQAAISDLPATDLVVGFTAGLGGSGIDDIVAGSQGFDNLLTVVAELANWARQLGITSLVPGVNIAVGGSDAAMVRATFRSKFEALQTACEDAFQYLTGQSEPVVFVFSQQTRNDSASPAQPSPPYAMFDAYLGDPTRFLATTPEFIHTLVDDIHFDANSAAVNGEFKGRALAQIVTATRIEPLKMNSAVRVANNVTVTFNRNITVDVSLVTDPGNRGFGLSAGSGVSISSVGAAAGATIVVTLSGAPAGGTKLTLGMQDNDGSGSSSTTGPRNNIRDANADNAVTDGSDMYYWGSRQDIPIT